MFSSPAHTLWGKMRRCCCCCLPSLRPPGVRALLSPGQVFLLAVIDTSSRTLSARAPSMPLGRRSTRTRWLSVPPEIFSILGERQNPRCRARVGLVRTPSDHRPVTQTCFWEIAIAHELIVKTGAFGHLLFFFLRFRLKFLNKRFRIHFFSHWK